MAADKTSERVDGKTPNGGDFSIAYFMDEKGNPVPKKQAKRAEIIEYKKDGIVIQRTYGTINA
jgi:hypothetical protein